MNKIRHFSLMASLLAITTVLLSILSLAGLSLNDEQLALQWKRTVRFACCKRPGSETDPVDD